MTETDSGNNERGDTLRCIYCGLQRPFNDEHVFPAGLGGDDRRFMLRNMVCETCNSETFSRLEAGLMRNSPEAFVRVHTQPRGRNRRKSSGGPKFQPESTTAILPEGGDAEAEIRAGGQVILLPQFSLLEKEIRSQSSELSDLKQFIASLGALFSQDSLSMVAKNSSAIRVYEILTYQWDGNCYNNVGTSVASNPPSICVWKDQRPNDNVVDRPYRIFQRSGGQIVLRAGSTGTDAQFMNTLRRNFRQLIDVANEGGAIKSITGMPIMVQMSPNLNDRERVFAKIGLNLCAFVFGESFVRQQCFDEIKVRILTGGTPVGGRDHHPQELGGDDIIAQILRAIPQKHHFCMITADRLPTGNIAVGFAIRLYGGALTSLTLTEVASGSLPNTPIFMLVDYINHKVSVLNLNDFVVQYLNKVGSEGPYG